MLLPAVHPETAISSHGLFHWSIRLLNYVVSDIRLNNIFPEGGFPK